MIGKDESSTMCFEHTGFFELLADAIFHYRESVVSAGELTSPREGYRANRHARASILAGVFGIECAANCLVESLEISRKLRDDIDKLPVIGKLDLCANLVAQRSINRGDGRLSKMAELIRARNEFVHPRSKRTSLDVEGVSETTFDYLVGISIEGENLPSLDIPRWPMFWTHLSATTVLTVCCDFLSWYFKDILAYQADRVSLLLSSRMVFGNYVSVAIFEEIYDEIRAVATQFDFSFLSIPDALEQSRRDTLWKPSP